MSARGDTVTEADELRDLRDRVTRLERLLHLKGTVSVGAIRVGGHVVEQGPSAELRSRRLSDNATVTIQT